MVVVNFPITIVISEQLNNNIAETSHVAYVPEVLQLYFSLLWGMGMQAMYEALNIFLCLQTDGTIESGLVSPKPLRYRVMDNLSGSGLYALCLNSFKRHRLSSVKDLHD